MDVDQNEAQDLDLTNGNWARTNLEQIAYDNSMVQDALETYGNAAFKEAQTAFLKNTTLTDKLAPRFISLAHTTFAPATDDYVYQARVLLISILALEDMEHHHAEIWDEVVRLDDWLNEENEDDSDDNEWMETNAGGPALPGPQDVAVPNGFLEAIFGITRALGWAMQALST
ncbi:unnamed protein product [Absidia cylindrospora]